MNRAYLIPREIFFHKIQNQIFLIFGPFGHRDAEYRWTWYPDFTTIGLSIRVYIHDEDDRIRFELQFAGEYKIK